MVGIDTDHPGVQRRFGRVAARGSGNRRERDHHEADPVPLPAGTHQTLDRSAGSIVKRIAGFRVAQENPAPARLLNILLAEDNLINQQVAARRLQKLGHTVEIANNGAEAVAALKARSYDLILMDVQMPEMDGFEATAAIRSMTGEKRRIPIIAMTANALPSDCERCLAAGMDDYIAKPVHQRTLVELIEKWGAIGYASAHPQPVAAVEFAHTDVDLLDLDGIREMIEVLGLDAYRDLTEQFFDSHGAAAGAFRDAAASGDYKHLGRLAHSLKGAASNLGLAVLAEQAAALQPRADEEHGAEA